MSTFNYSKSRNKNPSRLSRPQSKRNHEKIGNQNRDQQWHCHRSSSIGRCRRSRRIPRANQSRARGWIRSKRQGWVVGFKGQSQKVQMSFVTDLLAVLLDLLKICFNFKPTVTSVAIVAIEGTKKTLWTKLSGKSSLEFSQFRMLLQQHLIPSSFRLGIPLHTLSSNQREGFFGQTPTTISTSSWDYKLELHPNLSGNFPCSVCHVTQCISIYIFSAARQQKYLSLGSGKSLVSVPADDGPEPGGAGQRDAFVETLNASEGRITDGGVSHWLFNRQP